MTAPGAVGASPAGAASARAQRQFRWVTPLMMALLTGAYAAARAIHEPDWPTDFDQLWYAARALVHGGDPYAVVGPGRPFRWIWPLVYPPPAVLLSAPFVLLPIAWARVVFSTLSAALLGWAAGPRIRVVWPMVLSASYLIATSRTQWALLLLTAAWMPALGAVVAAKPTVGLAVLAALSRRRLVLAAAAAALITALSAALRPSSFADWIGAIRSIPPLKIPMLLPGGFVLVLAALRWRRPEARLLLVLAATPHTPSLYDLLLLFFACFSLRETMVLAILTHALFWGFVIWGSGATFDLYMLHLGQASIFVVYLPVLLMILRRPNLSPTVAQGEALTLPGWRGSLPTRRLDLMLLGVLAFAGAMLVWLPLATYR